jgi:hypothetical protein
VFALSDGSIAVMDAGNHAIRYFDRTGTSIGRVGRLGKGPGEFTSDPGRAITCGTDTIYVRALHWGRILVFGPERRFERGILVPGHECLPRTLGDLPQFGPLDAGVVDGGDAGILWVGARTVLPRMSGFSHHHSRGGPLRGSRPACRTPATRSSISTYEPSVPLHTL